jgi:hypothetical protein
VTDARGSAEATPNPARLQAAAQEARNDAAPFALVAAGVMIALAPVSRHAHRESLGHRLWWMWLVVAAPCVGLSATLLFGLGRLVRHNRRREIVVALLAVVWMVNVSGVVVLVFSLLFHSGSHVTGWDYFYVGLTNGIDHDAARLAAKPHRRKLSQSFPGRKSSPVADLLHRCHQRKGQERCPQKTEPGIATYAQAGSSFGRVVIGGTGDQPPGLALADSRA